MDEMIKMRDTMRETVDILDEFISLKANEDTRADVTKECESILGRFVLKLMELQSLQQKL